MKNQPIQQTVLDNLAGVAIGAVAGGYALGKFKKEYSSFEKFSAILIGGIAGMFIQDALYGKNMHATAEISRSLDNSPGVKADRVYKNGKVYDGDGNEIIIKKSTDRNGNTE